MNTRLADALAAIAGGTLGAAAMDAAQSAFAAVFERGRASDDRDEEVEAIESVVRLLGTTFPSVARRGNARVTARVVHYAFGIAFGWAYVAGARRAPGSTFGGGGALLTPLGAEIVRRYRAIEARIATDSRADVRAIERALA
ncbi:MAG: hypothetical protein NVSMB21_03820 [Vulcanimicrobiaceae bacterium]